MKPQDTETVFFSPRERRVVPGILSAYSYKEIAGDLHIAPSTVQLHMSNLLRKLNLRTREEFQLWAEQHPDDVVAGHTRERELHGQGCNCSGQHCAMMRAIERIAA